MSVQSRWERGVPREHLCGCHTKLSQTPELWFVPFSKPNVKNHSLSNEVPFSTPISPYLDHISTDDENPAEKMARFSYAFEYEMKKFLFIVVDTSWNFCCT